MKKLLCIVLALILALSTAACGGKTDDTVVATTSAAAAENTVVDVDLTKLSSTMLYSEVNNMASTPDNYLGKVVKMKGKFAVYSDDSTGKLYYACTASDVNACCSAGLEFILKDTNKKYPTDYPSIGADITICGTFSTYMEGKNQYCELRNADLTVG